MMMKTMTVLKKMMIFVWRMLSQRILLNFRRNFRRRKNKLKECINLIDSRFMIKKLTIIILRSNIQLMGVVLVILDVIS